MYNLVGAELEYLALLNQRKPMANPIYTCADCGAAFVTRAMGTDANGASIPVCPSCGEPQPLRPPLEPAAPVAAGQRGQAAQPVATRPTLPRPFVAEAKGTVNGEPEIGRAHV